MHKRGLCRHAVSVCPSITFVNCAKTNKDIFEIVSSSGSHTILVFPYQTAWRYSNGNPSNGGVECRWGRQKNAILDEYLASLHTGLQCCQPYTSSKVWKQSRDERLQASSRALTAASVVRCSQKTTTKCLWRARRYTPETMGGQTVQTPRTQPPLGHNPRFLLP